MPEYGPLVTGTAADASGVRRFRLVMYQRLQSTRVRLLDLYGTESVRA